MDTRVSFLLQRHAPRAMSTNHFLINPPGDGYCGPWALQLLIAMLYGVTVQLKPLLQDKLLKKELSKLDTYARIELEQDYHNGTSFDINTIANSWTTIIHGCSVLSQTGDMFRNPAVYICNNGRNQSWETIHALLERDLVAYGLVCHGGHFYLAVKRDRIPDFFSRSSEMFFVSMVSDLIHPDLSMNIFSHGDQWMTMWEADARKNTIHAMHVAYLLSQQKSLEEIGRNLSLHSMYLDYMSQRILGDSSLSFQEHLQTMSIAKLAAWFGVGFESSSVPSATASHGSSSVPMAPLQRYRRRAECMSDLFAQMSLDDDACQSDAECARQLRKEDDARAESWIS